MTRASRLLVGVMMSIGTFAIAACQREERNFRSAPPFAAAVPYENDYQENAYSLSEGKRLYSAFNCKMCHADGGGAIGPPLMDDGWLYGSEPHQIFDTISHGRADGMPAFGGVARDPSIKVVGTLPEHQRWLLVAYVRSLSGLAPKDAAPGRNDHLQTRVPEHSTEPASPRPEPPIPDVEPSK